MAFTAEKSWFAEKDTYSESVEEMGFMPERGNRYMYVVAPSGDALVPGGPAGGTHTRIEADSKYSPDNAALLAAIPPALLAETGVHGTCPDACRITVVAVGNLDGDSDVDLWSVSTEARTIDGAPVPAGQPYNHHSDL
jgi:type IV pilus assembly protein PilA